MVRPIKCRLIAQEPNIDYFKPIGIPLVELEEIRLALDEFEALRLADLDGLYQEQASKQMKVSRATFGNILAGARRKLAEALIEGKAIRIEGGVFHMKRHERFGGNARRRQRQCRGQGGAPSVGEGDAGQNERRGLPRVGPAGAGRGRRRRRGG